MNKKIAKNNLIPRKLLFGNPERLAPKISPDGKMLSYLAPVDNVLNLWLGEIQEDLNFKSFRPITTYKHKGIGAYFWAKNGNYLMYLQDINGDENWHLNSINIHTLEIKDYTPYANVQAKIAEHNKFYPNEIILSLNLKDPGIHDLYHLDLNTGYLKEIHNNPGNFVSWEIDNDLQLRAVTATNEKGGFDLLIKSSDKDDEIWNKFIEWNLEDSANINIEGFSKDSKYIYIRDSRDYNTSRLLQINLETGETYSLFEDTDYDINYVMLNPDNCNVELVSVLKEREHIYILDEKIFDDINNISNINNGEYLIYDRDNLDKNWIIAFNNDNLPSSYYLYNRDKKESKLLFYNKPKLLEYNLSKMEPFSFISRDNLKIQGYLTFPTNRERKNLPSVLYVHGGPWLRDSWGLNNDVQWLANRGYLCIQVNFRGSSGYGKSFLNAGDKEWGAKMQNDLLDAVNFVVNEGFADPENIAIYGVSYGGYAALSCITSTHDIFKCAIDVVGPSNLITMIENIPPYWKMFLDNLKKRVGDPETEQDFLKSISPLFNAEKITTPLLIVHGANDPRVKISESEQIVNVLKEKKIGHEYLMFYDEGHGITKPYNRERFYKVAEKFLSKYLGGEFEEGSLELFNYSDRLFTTYE